MTNSPHQILTDIRSDGRHDTAVQAVIETLLRVAPVGFVVIDRDHRFMLVNDRAAEINGLPIEEHIGRRVEDLLPGLEGQSELLERVLTTGDVVRDVEVRGETPAAPGVVRDWSAHYYPIRDGDLITGVGIVFQEITDKKRAADELRMSEERYRTLAESIPAMVTLTQTDGRTVYVSQSLREYTGLGPGDLETPDWLSLFHPDDVAAQLAAWLDCIQRGEAIVAEARIRRYDGVYRWHMGHVAPVKDDNGAVHMWIGAHVDIDDRKRFEEAVRDSQRLTRRVADASLDMNASLSVDEVLARLTVNAQEIIGAHQAVTTMVLDRDWGRAVTHTILSDKYAKWRDYDVLPTGAGIYRIVCEGNRPVRLTQAELEAHPYYRGFGEHAESHPPMRGWLAAPLIGADGRNLGFIQLSDKYEGEFNEVDEAIVVQLAQLAAVGIENAMLYQQAKDVADQLAKANRAKDEFLGLVSHELKTPITTIYGNAQVLRRRFDVIDAASRAGALEDIAHESERLHRIIDNLLVLARLEQGQELDSEPVVIRRIAQRVIDEQVQRMPQRAIALNDEDVITPVWGQPIYAEQILRNLLSNAVKYSPADAPIDVSIVREGDELCVAVLDRGKGIPDEECDAIFTPFYRSPRTADQAGGVGIGLAVCKRLVEAQGGRMWARARQGGGADIGFALPVIPDDGPSLE